MAVNPEFGAFFRKKRHETGLTLREFCIKHDLDPGNMSKLERGILPPPRDEEKKRKYAKALGIREGTDDWYTFFDLAAACAGSLPNDIAANEEIIRALPAFFRVVRTAEDSEKVLERLIEAVKKELS
jgi:transcriptional regulator with XRE-family HTH domain